MNLELAAIASFHFVLAILLAPVAAAADTYPNKPVRFIIPVPAGAGADFTGRTYAQRLSVGLAQQVIVDNRGGAGGIIAMETAAKAPPDGYTLVQATVGTVCIMPFMYAKLPYDALRDYEPVSVNSLNPLLLVVHPSMPVRTLSELIAYGKANPERISYASVGSGSVQHLAGFVFAKEAGISAVHVPYKGAAPATVDLLAGQVNVAFSGVGTVAGHIKAGRVRVLAVTSANRVQAFPDVPTMKEAGGPDVEMSLWNGILVPAHTPRAIVMRLNAEIVKASHSPELNAAMATQATLPASNSPEEFAAMIRKDRDRYAKIVMDSGARAD